jgi:hypothetical protein
MLNDLQKSLEEVHSTVKQVSTPTSNGAPGVPGNVAGGELETVKDRLAALEHQLAVVQKLQSDSLFLQRQLVAGQTDLLTTVEQLAGGGRQMGMARPLDSSGALSRERTFQGTMVQGPMGHHGPGPGQGAQMFNGHGYGGPPQNGGYGSRPPPNGPGAGDMDAGAMLQDCLAPQGDGPEYEDNGLQRRRMSEEAMALSEEQFTPRGRRPGGTMQI